MAITMRISNSRRMATATDGNDNGGNDLAANDGNKEEGAEEEATNDGERCATPIRGVNLNTPEASCTEVEEERELMLLKAAEHIKMARA